MITDSLTQLDIFKKAATHKGLELGGGTDARARSEPIKIYTLGDELFADLETRGFKKQIRPDCNYEILTLTVDEKGETDYWNFKLIDEKNKEEGLDLRIFLTIEFEINFEKDGVVLWPCAHGSFMSPAKRSSHLRMFKTLVEADENASDIAREIASSGGSIIVTWTDLGLDDIQRIDDLFTTFAGDNEAIEQLARSALSVFKPNPHAHDKLFIIKSAQSEIVKTWRGQLDWYRNSLVVQV